MCFFLPRLVAPRSSLLWLGCRSGAGGLPHPHRQPGAAARQLAGSPPALQAAARARPAAAYSLACRRRRRPRAEGPWASASAGPKGGECDTRAPLAAHQLPGRRGPHQPSLGGITWHATLPMSKAVAMPRGCCRAPSAARGLVAPGCPALRSAAPTARTVPRGLGTVLCACVCVVPTA